MKNRLLILIACFIGIVAKAQVVTQSAEGKGSVLLPLNGVSIGFDIGKTEISVGANNYSKALDKNNNKIFNNWFFGGNLSVKNSSGIGNLFQSGDIVPAANLLGFLGFNVNNNRSILDAWKTSHLNDIRKEEQKKRLQLVEEFRSGVLKDIEASVEIIEDQGLRDKTRSNILDMINKSTNGFALNETISKIIDTKDKSLENFVQEFKQLLEPRRKAYLEKLSKVDATKEMDAAFSEFMKTHCVKRLTPFIFGGIDARSFSWYTGLNTSTLANSFTDTLFRGGQFGVGINAQLGTWWLGVTYAYVDGDNFSNLSSSEYTLRTTDTSVNQALVSEKKITGYSGRYARVENNQLNIDLLKEFKLGDTSRIITNLYYRGSLFSRDTAYLKNISNLGLGLYFLGKKSKFLGGLYVELPDINNNIEKSKPESERSIRPPFKKLTFGVVTKFSLASILGFENRPRKPD
jgi:hypothetical protein